MLERNKPGIARGKIVLATAILLLALGFLYWWTIRPYVASRSCHTTALENTGYTRDNAGQWARNESVQSDYSFMYEVCMHKEGINP